MRELWYVRSVMPEGVRVEDVLFWGVLFVDAMSVNCSTWRSKQGRLKRP